MDSVQEQLALIIIITIVFNILVVFAISLFYSAESDLKFVRMELPVSLNDVNGKLKVLEESLVFIDEDESEICFAIERNNIIELSEDNSVLIIQTKEPINYLLGENSRFIFCIECEKTEDSGKWLEEARDFFSLKTAKVC